MRKNNETPKILVMVGPSNSGKSSWAEGFLRENPGWVRMNRDSIRHMLQFTPMMDKRGEELVTRILDEAAENALIAGYNVLLDNMHCKLANLQNICARFSDVADIEFHVMPDVPIEVLRERAVGRSKKDGYPVIPNWVLERAQNNFNELKTQFDFMPIKKRQT